MTKYTGLSTLEVIERMCHLMKMNYSFSMNVATHPENPRLWDLEVDEHIVTPEVE